MAGLATHLHYHEPSNYVLVSFLQQGLFHDLCQPGTDGKATLLTYLGILHVHSPLQARILRGTIKIDEPGKRGRRKWQAPLPDLSIPYPSGCFLFWLSFLRLYLARPSLNQKQIKFTTHRNSNLLYIYVMFPFHCYWQISRRRHEENGTCPESFVWKEIPSPQFQAKDTFVPDFKSKSDFLYLEGCYLFSKTPIYLQVLRNGASRQISSWSCSLIQSCSN